MKFKRYIPALLWSGIIFFGCLIPGNDLPKEDFLDKIYFDKIVHAFMYFILLRLIVNGMKGDMLLKRQILIAAVICISQGVVIEFLQGSSLIKNRSFEFMDIIANTTGVILSGAWIYQKNKVVSP